MGATVNSEVTLATAGQEGPSPMEQETVPRERINKTTLFVTGVVSVRLFLKWLKEETGGVGSARMQGDKFVLVPKYCRLLQGHVEGAEVYDYEQGYGLPYLELARRPVH